MAGPIYFVARGEVRNPSDAFVSILTWVKVRVKRQPKFRQKCSCRRPLRSKINCLVVWG